MNTPIPPIWTTTSTESIKTGTWRAALPRHISAPSPCHAACPVSGDIAQWIGHVREGDWYGAWQVLTRHNPFPAVAGRICHHPCESVCNRAGYDESLAICRLERAVGDHAIAQAWRFDAPKVLRAQRVAVVGGGPAGLSAAYQLRRLGYPVTLYEARAQLGGLMRDGIPSYRLARSVLDAEIARIVALGVDVRCGQALDTPADLERLRREHDALFLALGAQHPKRLPQLDHNRPWVLDAAAYLAQANAGAPPALGARVVVIGGGSAALDAARNARRAGHAVSIVSLEARGQMPAQPEEVIEALEEGITLVDGAMLDAVVEQGDAGLVLRCRRVRFQPGARHGQFTVAPIDGSDFTLAADAVVPSIGQDPDLAPLQGAFEIRGALLQVDAHQATSAARVYAGGDVASLARFVTEAVGMGQRAAHEIHRVLSRADARADATADEAVVSLGAIATYYHPMQPRAAEARLDVAQRLATGAEVQLGLDVEQALAESERCFSCGSCIRCDHCVAYCPDLAVRRLDDGYEVLADYCKGCGVCVRECPTGSMKMVQEQR